MPGFCDFPTDFGDSFKNLAKVLGEVLEKCGDLRSSILQSLRTLVNRNTDENRALMAKYAKNYLPIMFNIYTTEIRLDKDPIRQALIDTVRCFLKVTDADLVNTYLIQAIRNYESFSKQHEEALQKSKEADLNNNVGKVEPVVIKGGSKKVVFDFSSSSKKESSTVNIAEPFLFAKYSFLDLIAVLAKYSNTMNIQVVYDLAINGIEVEFS